MNTQNTANANAIPGAKLLLAGDVTIQRDPDSGWIYADLHGYRYQQMSGRTRLTIGETYPAEIRTELGRMLYILGRVGRVECWTYASDAPLADGEQRLGEMLAARRAWPHVLDATGASDRPASSDQSEMFPDMRALLAFDVKVTGPTFRMRVHAHDLRELVRAVRVPSFTVNTTGPWQVLSEMDTQVRLAEDPVVYGPPDDFTVGVFVPRDAVLAQLRRVLWLTPWSDLQFATYAQRVEMNSVEGVSWSKLLRHLLFVAMNGFAYTNTCYGAGQNDIAFTRHGRAGYDVRLTLRRIGTDDPDGETEHELDAALTSDDAEDEFDDDDDI